MFKILRRSQHFHPPSRVTAEYVEELDYWHGADSQDRKETILVANPVNTV
jgi:hypothetical protein